MSKLITKFLVLAIVAVFVMPGCVKFKLKGRTEPEVKQYAINYPPPEFSVHTGLNVSLKVRRFSIARAIGTPLMFYSTAPESEDPYQYSRWRTNPADMITDLLIRDLKGSGLFNAVFSYYDTEEARFYLGGFISEFVEKDSDGKPGALISMNITLIDRKVSTAAGHVILQKKYSAFEPIGGKNAAAFATGMGKASRKLSRQIITDIYEVIKNQ